VKSALLVLLLGAGDHAFVETETARESYFVHEPIRVTLRIGFDRAFFQTNAVQLFHRRLEVPLQVLAPWIVELPGTVLRSSEARRPGRSIALNDEVVEASPAGERPPFAVLEIERTYLPTRPGELAIPAPRLRYAYGTEFEEDFIGGRVPLDRRDAVVEGEPRVLEIRALPEEGRPPGYTGAVGRRLSVRAEASPRSLDAGSITKLVLCVEGEGNLEHFDPPPLELDGFHVYGLIDDRSAARRTITYDLAPLGARAEEIPSIPFPFFDTEEPAGYRTVRTRPIPLEVFGGETETTSARGESARGALLLVVLGVCVALLLLLVLRRRRPGPDPAATFRAGGGDLAERFADYLAARLRCAPAAVISPDLPGRLTAAGVTAELADRTAALLEELVGARYGGAAEGRAEAALRLVDELEAELG
jgi:hypothetical protein